MKACTSVVVMPSRRMRAAALCASSVMFLAVCISATSCSDLIMRQAAVTSDPLTKEKELPAFLSPSKVKNGVASSIAIVPLFVPPARIVSMISAVGSSSSSHCATLSPKLVMVSSFSTSKAGDR